MTPGVGVTILYFVYIFKSYFLKNLFKEYFLKNSFDTKRIYLKEYIKRIFKYFLKVFAICNMAFKDLPCPL